MKIGEVINTKSDRYLVRCEKMRMENNNTGRYEIGYLLEVFNAQPSDGIICRVYHEWTLKKPDIERWLYHFQTN